MGQKLAPDKALTILDAATEPRDRWSPGLGRVTGIPKQTVSDYLARFQPVADELRQLKRDHLLGTWQLTYFQAASDMAALADLPRNTVEDRRKIASTARDLAVTMGICTDKTLLLSGQPTAIFAGMHDVRIQLPEIAARLLSLTRPRQIVSTPAIPTPPEP